MEADESQKQKRGDRWSKERRKSSTLCVVNGHMSSQEFEVRPSISKIRGKAPKKYKGRVVLWGDIVKDDSGSYAAFTEQGSSASQMTAAKIMDIISRLPGCDGQAADAVSAYTQVKMEDAHKLLKIPKSECPDIWIRLPRHKWPKSWSSMEDPVVPLERNLYGHPLAGLLWERQFEKILIAARLGEGFQFAMLIRTPWKRVILICVCGWQKNLAGKEQNIDPMWKVLNKEADLGEPTSFLDHVCLGCTQRQCEISKDIADNYRAVFESSGWTEKLPYSENFRISSWSYDMEGHAKKCVERYCELPNKTTQQLCKVATPCLDDHRLKEEELKSVGELSKVSSQIVLTCLYLARNGRPDILWSVNKLARSITQWTKACDKRLNRLISYIHHTCEYNQYCYVGNTAIQCRLGLFQDSDFAGDLQDSKSTSGGTLCVLGSHPQRHGTSWKRIVLICVCGWHKIGWKETKSWSDVGSTLKRSRFGRTNIFPWSCILGLHSKTMWNKQRYFWQLQNHVWIAKLRGGNWKITMFGKSSYFFMVLWYGWSCKEVRGTILWVGKQDDSTTLQSIYSMHRWPSLQRRRIEIRGRIVKYMLSNCSEMLMLGTNWKTWYSTASEQTCAIDYKMDQSLWQTPESFDFLHSSQKWIQKYCHLGNTAQQCRLGLFQDSDFAGDLEDSISTSGGTLCVFGSHTFVPISWMCKKHFAPGFVAPGLLWNMVETEQEQIRMFSWAGSRTWGPGFAAAAVRLGAPLRLERTVEPGLACCDKFFDCNVQLHRKVRGYSGHPVNVIGRVQGDL